MKKPQKYYVTLGHGISIPFYAQGLMDEAQWETWKDSTMRSDDVATAVVEITVCAITSEMTAELIKNVHPLKERHP